MKGEREMQYKDGREKFAFECVSLTIVIIWSVIDRRASACLVHEK